MTNAGIPSNTRNGHGGKILLHILRSIDGGSGFPLLEGSSRRLNLKDTRDVYVMQLHGDLLLGCGTSFRFQGLQVGWVPFGEEVNFFLGHVLQGTLAHGVGHLEVSDAVD